MQGLKIFVVLEEMADHGARQHVQRARLQVNYRRGSDADFGLDERTLHVTRGNGFFAAHLIQQTHPPERRIVWPFGIERVHAVMLCRHKEHVVLAFARNFHPGKEQRLRVDRSIHLEYAELPEMLRVHVLQR